jgi:hypothetical protein
MPATTVAQTWFSQDSPFPPNRQHRERCWKSQCPEVEKTFSWLRVVSFPTLLRLSAPEKKYDKEGFLRRGNPAVGTTRQDQTTRQKQDNARNQTRGVT